LRQRVLQAELACLVYTPDRSYVQTGSFLRVWNFGTPQWEEVEAEFGLCNFESARVAASEFPTTRRGNRARSYGYSGQSFKADPVSFVQKPVLRSGTRKWEKHMESLSSLQAACGARPPSTSTGNPHRLPDFGGKISEHNFLEGLTVAVSDVLTETVNCHLDTQNDSSTGFSTVIVASEIKQGERIILCGYMKQCVGAYYTREVFTREAVATARALLREVEQWERRFPMISGHSFSPHSCIDKAVRLAPFVHILVDLISIFRLSYKESIQALLSVTFVTTSDYWMFGSQWIQTKKLPTRNLAYFFHDIATKISGIRQPLLPVERIEPVLQVMGEIFQNSNNSNSTNRHSYHQLVSSLQTIWEPSESEVMLRMEDLVTVAALAGVGTHSKFATQACLSQSTPTLAGIKTMFCCNSISQASGIVNAVARALQISPAISHALFRQMLKLDPSYLTSYSSSDLKLHRGLTLFRADACGISRSRPVVPIGNSSLPSSPFPILDAGFHGFEGFVGPGIAAPSSPLTTRKVRKKACTTKTNYPRKFLFLSRSTTRSSTTRFPMQEAVVRTVIPWAEVVLLRDVSEQVCVHPILDGNSITCIAEGRHWRATCVANGVTWNAGDEPNFGGLAHSCHHPSGIGTTGVLYHSKSAARDSLLVYMLVYGGGPSFNWVRRILGDHHFVRVRKQESRRNVDPLFLICRHKGYICIGHFKDNWGTRTRICKV
jgi:hypothetical protein